MKELSVGIIGFGTVGAGVAEILLTNSEVIAKRTGVKLTLKRIADLDITTDRGIEVPSGVLTTDAAVAIKECDIIVELVGGTTVAKKFILEALNSGKPVVTANKALLAKYGEELFAAAEKSGVDMGYEASVAGGIPIIKALREGLAANRVNAIYGILNGTCNYILTRMEREGADFKSVLADAQKLGYAEADPTLDVDGFDTAHKTSILASLAYGKWFGMDPVYVEGIRDLEPADLKCAEGLGYRIKLLGIIKNDNGAVQMRVHPTLIPRDTLMADIMDVFNGVLVDGDFVDRTIFYGRGAGRRATASAVVADLVDVALNIAGGSVRRVPPFRPGAQFSSVQPMEAITSRYCLRLTVKDKAEALAAVGKALAKYSAGVADKSYGFASGEGAATLAVLTGPVEERTLRAALAAVEAEALPGTGVKVLRVEDL